MMETLASQTAAAWAQAILSALAIIVAGLFAVWVPYRERKITAKSESRARLKITTTTFAPAGLQLVLTYEPEFQHVGIFARVTLLSPDGAKLKEGKQGTAPAQDLSGSYVRFDPWSEFVEGAGNVRLVKLGSSRTLTGAVFIVPPAIGSPAISKARVKIDVQTDAEAKLLSEEFTVSAIDQPA
jgi:hypothetical protein